MRVSEGRATPREDRRRADESAGLRSVARLAGWRGRERQSRARVRCGGPGRPGGAAPGDRPRILSTQHGPPAELWALARLALRARLAGTRNGYRPGIAG